MEVVQTQSWQMVLVLAVGRCVPEVVVVVVVEWKQKAV